MIGRALRGAITGKKPRAKIIRVVRITAVGNHAWVDSDYGLIKKPLSAIPAGLVRDYREAQYGRQ